MKQIYKYKVQSQGNVPGSILNSNDAALVDTYVLGIQSFNPNESRLDVNIYDEENNLLESLQDVSDYKILGVEQGPDKVNQLEVDPTAFVADRSYVGKSVVVEYTAFNNIYARNAELFITDISTDRQEIRAKSLVVSDSDLRYYTSLLRDRFENQSYFSEVYIELDKHKYPIVNAISEVVDGTFLVAFKLYEPLPDSIQKKATFQLLESLGDAARFSVQENIVVFDDPPTLIKGPNFGAELKASTVVTPYRNYLELLSQKSWDSSKELYTSFKKASQHISVNYEDFSNFIHFSSAVERLENARYKFELIFEYQHQIEDLKHESSTKTREDEIKKLEDTIQGIIDNFDHYENYLYFEEGPAAWPKKRKSYPDGNVIRPYENIDHPQDLILSDIEDREPGYESWYDEILAAAERYDENNKDILISTIPVAIREDVDNNEPYIMFIHMIGQHFDDIWIYAKAISDRYKADNRPEFGISKELVKDAIETFGLDLYETNQNLNALFELVQPDGTYSSGLETAVQAVNIPTGSWRPQEQRWSDSYLGTGSVDVPSSWTADSGSWQGASRTEAYTKEVYKRIYHNIPLLVKTKGTSRGLRVLLNCFGVPNSTLTFRTQGGTSSENRPFFGPEEAVQISPKFDEKTISCSVGGETYSASVFLAPTGSVEKIRTADTSVPPVEYMFVDGTGSFYTSSILSRYASTTSSVPDLTDDSHKVEIGFDLNEAVNHFFATHVTESFTVDDVLGDPRNKEEQYGDAWRNIREQILNEVHTEGKTFRSPAALIRFVRYFDTTFFRMLQDFLPARASIDSAVIVKDNILHRNRWPGVDVDLKELSMSGSTTGSQITGSHGGSFEYAGKGINTGTGSHFVVNPDRGRVEKPVASGSREFTGELAGSELNTLTGGGDLSQYNTHRKDSQPSNHYDYVVWFLDLPDPPLCGCGFSSQSTFGFYSIKAIGGPANIQVNGSTQSIASGSTKYLAGENYSTGKVVNTQWSPGVSMGGKLFIGTAVSSSSWTGSTAGTLSPSSDFTFTNVDYTRNRVHIVYDSASNINIFWTEIIKPTGQQYYSDDLMVSWKYLPSGSNPKTTRTGTIPWTGTDSIKISVTRTNNTTASLSVPASSIFGTTDGYYWIGTGSMQNVDITKRYGLTSLAGKIGPYRLNGNTLVDTTWYANYSDWWNNYLSTHTWEVTTGSAVPHSDNEHWL